MATERVTVTLEIDRANVADASAWRYSDASARQIASDLLAPLVAHAGPLVGYSVDDSEGVI